MSRFAGDSLVELAAKVATKDDFVAFANALLANLRNQPEEWENQSLQSFFQGLVGFAQDSEGYYANLGVSMDPNRPSWRTFADILLAARVYE